MKVIEVGLSKSSIEKAIKEIEQYQKNVLSAISEILERSADKIISLANERIAAYDFDQEIITGIQSGWEKEKGKDGLSLILKNTNDKAVFLEFGVGQVGQANSHEQAEAAGYEYDKNAHGNEGWNFYVGADEGVDIVGGLYEAQLLGNNRFRIYTKGSPATMYLFNAAMDFCDKGMIEPIAKQVIKELGL